MAKWDEQKMADLTRKLADTAIEQNELYQAALRDAKEAEAYAEELEAKLAKAETRLQHIAANKVSDELSVVEWDTHDTFSILDGCILSARTTLAELKGQDDE